MGSKAALSKLYYSNSKRFNSCIFTTHLLPCKDHSSMVTVLTRHTLFGLFIFGNSHKLKSHILFNYHSSLSQYLIKWVRTYLNFIRSKEYVGFEVVYGFIDDIKICAWKYKSKHYRPCGIHCLLNNAAVDNCDCLCIKHCHTMHVHCIITKSRSKY